MLRLKDEKLKERDLLLRTLQSQDSNSVTLARKNQAQKAKLKSQVMRFFFKICFDSSFVFVQDEIIKMRDREIVILRETMKREAESEDEAENEVENAESSKPS